ncbi:MAG: transcription elongation factor GreA [Bacilli bacterium]|nr:transcription elongation factor GreA [Bacilli bacterium]
MIEKQKITRDYYNELNAELRDLEDVQRPDNEQKLAAARAQGDLSENAEFNEERDRQGRINGRILEIKAILENMVIIDDEVFSNNLGKYVTIIYEEDGFVYEFQLIGASIESDPFVGKVSIESPLGRAVLEANVGDHIVVKPEKGNDFSIVVTKIETK